MSRYVSLPGQTLLGIAEALNLAGGEFQHLIAEHLKVIREGCSISFLLMENLHGLAVFGIHTFDKTQHARYVDGTRVRAPLGKPFDQCPIDGNRSVCPSSRHGGGVVSFEVNASP